MAADRLAAEGADAVGSHLRRGAQVDHLVDAQLVAQERDVRRGEMVQAVAAEELTPAQLAAVAGRISAQVAEVQAPL